MCTRINIVSSSPTGNPLFSVTPSLAITGALWSYNSVPSSCPHTTTFVVSSINVSYSGYTVTKSVSLTQSSTVTVTNTVSISTAPGLTIPKNAVPESPGSGSINIVSRAGDVNDVSTPVGYGAMYNLVVSNLASLGSLSASAFVGSSTFAPASFASLSGSPSRSVSHANGLLSPVIAFHVARFLNAVPLKS